MYILFDPDSGEIFQTVFDRDWFAFQNPITVPHVVFAIDETEENRAVCLDMVGTIYQMDALGRRKYYMQRVDDGEWALHMRENWEPVDPLREALDAGTPGA